MRNSAHHTRAFVLQFDLAADPAAGRFEGRVEHVASGRSVRFTTTEELIAFVVRVLNTPDETDEPGA